MAALIPQHLFWAFTLIQVAGLGSAALSRMAHTRAIQTSCELLFFGFLAVVACVTIGSIALGWAAWIVSAFTLSLMVVTAIWDPGARATR